MQVHESTIPDRFWHVPYNAARFPGEAGGLDGGANCQFFAYELLRAFGISMPPFRSSELWHDTVHCARVSEAFEPLDLLLFNRTADPYGAHVALFLGDARAIHLSQRVGLPAIWTIDHFLTEPDYSVLIGGKRPIGKVTT